MVRREHVARFCREIGPIEDRKQSRETTGSHESLTNFVNDIRAFERNEVG